MLTNTIHKSILTLLGVALSTGLGSISPSSLYTPPR